MTGSPCDALQDRIAALNELHPKGWAGDGISTYSRLRWRIPTTADVEKLDRLVDLLLSEIEALDLG